MNAELIALNAEIASYMAAHTSVDDWPPSLRAFDVAADCGNVALDEGAALTRPAMFAARLGVAVWIDDNERNRPAQFQLREYLASL